MPVGLSFLVSKSHRVAMLRENRGDSPRRSMLVLVAVRKLHIGGLEGEADDRGIVIIIIVGAEYRCGDGVLDHDVEDGESDDEELLGGHGRGPLFFLCLLYDVGGLRFVACWCVVFLWRRNKGVLFVGIMVYL